MKLTKRFILAVLCIALALTSTLLIVVACDQEETGFKVTVAEYDNQQGTVSVSSPAEGKLYDNGEKVTVTVTPATDYEVATFVVSGHDDATLNNEGKYEFEISSDITVTVTFVQNQPEPTTFTVTVGSVQNGTVKLDPEKDAYTEGESVTVTVTPANGYEVATFTVSGHDGATLNDEGKYTFQVTGNTTVSATFEMSRKATMSEELLKSLQGNLRLQGSCFIQRDGSELTYSELTVFAEGAFYNWEMVQNSGNIVEITVFKNSDGVPVRYFLKKDNTIGEEVVTKDTDYDGIPDTPAVWEDFANPFDALTVEDFTAGDVDGEYVLDFDSSQRVASVITGYSETIAYFVVYAENDKITSMRFATTIDGGLTSDYDYEVSECDDSQLPKKPDVLQKTADHTKLEEALQELSTGNYTLTHSQTEGSDNVTYTVYYGDNAYFYDYTNGIIVPGGAVVQDDGIYKFSYENKVLKRGEKVTGSKNIKKYNPRCNFDVALFEDKGDGLFEARSLYLYESKGYICQVVSADLDNNSDCGNYAVDLQIKLTSDMSHVEYIQYNYERLYTKGTMKLTYSNFGSTTVPLDFSDMIVETEELEFPGPTGEFVADSNKLGVTNIVITETTISFDGEEMALEIVAGYATNSIRFVYKGQTFTGDYYESTGQWFFMTTDFTVYFYASPVQ